MDILIVVLAVAILGRWWRWSPGSDGWPRRRHGRTWSHLERHEGDRHRAAQISYVLVDPWGARSIALSLGVSLHAVGEHANFATLIVVITLAAIIGGAVPVPGAPASSKSA